MDAEEYNIILYKWKITAKNKLEKRLYVEESNQKLFSILLDKFSEAMRSKLEGTKGYDQLEADQDGIAILKFTDNIMVGVEDSLQQMMAIY